MFKRITSFNVIMPISYSRCPKNMTVNDCPLRAYIKTGDSVFVPVGNDLYLQQRDSHDFEKIQTDFERMKSICAHCKEKNNEK